MSEAMRQSDIDFEVVLDVLPQLPVRFYTKDLSEHPLIAAAYSRHLGDQSYDAAFGAFLAANATRLGIRRIELASDSGRGALWEQDVTHGLSSGELSYASSQHAPTPGMASLALVCPKCKKNQSFTVSTDSAIVSLNCPQCGTTFMHHAVRIRAKRSRGDRSANQRHFSIRVIYPSGQESLVEFTNANYGDFELRSGDMVSLCYLGGELRLVQNHTINYYYLVSRPGCFVATYVFGADDARTLALRNFRDEVLLPHRAGRLLVHMYYKLSPVLVRGCATHALLRQTSTVILVGLLRLTNRA